MKPTISVIIANRNGAEHLRTCLPSLLAQSYEPIEIVVVDNSSSDDSSEVTKQYGANWLPLKENMGLAPALNRGAAVASGEMLLFINNDMRFEEGFVAHLAKCLDEDDGVFAADGRQFNWDGTAEGHLATRLGTSSAANMSLELVPGLFLYQIESEYPTEAFMASAASMLVRRSYFELLGGFEERLPLSYEDVELCWRARVNGWRTMYVPAAVCWHRVGSSCRSSEGSSLLFTGVLKGRLTFAAKLLPIRYGLLTWASSSAGLVKDIGRLRWRFAWRRIKVLAQSALEIRQLLRARNELYRGTTAKKQLDHMLRLADAEHVVSPAARVGGKKCVESG
jgi:GT2 family glycosyltransferase